MGVLGAIFGGVMQSSAANKAAKAQTKAADAQLALQDKIYTEQTQNFKPYLSAGNNALAAVMHQLGLGPAPTVGGTAPAIETIGGVQPGVQPSQPVARATGSMKGRDSANPYSPNAFAPQSAPQQYRVGGQTFNSYDDAMAFANAHKTGGTEYQGFQETPGYQFQFDQGTAAVNALAGAKGGLNSGATMKALTDYGQGVANQEYGNYFQRLMNLVSGGQSAAGNQAAAGGNYAANASNALANKGNAQSAGAIGVGNAFSGMANNLIGLAGYQNGTKAPNTSGIGWGDWGLGF